MPRADANVDDEYDAFMARNGETEASPKPKNHPIARALAGWWFIAVIAFGAIGLVFDPGPSFNAWFFIILVLTMPICIIAAVVASRPTEVKVGLGAHHLPRV